MTEKLVTFLLGVLAGIKAIPFGRELIAFLLSMVPILELRGGILAARALGLNPAVSFIICYIGNILPVPFILWLIKSIIDKMRTSNVGCFKKFVLWLEKGRTEKGTN